ncbi:MAG: ribonuclease R [Pirellulales bacterium]|nr:ribonuclease R [Pirellulales bacterium]
MKEPPPPPSLTDDQLEQAILDLVRQPGYQPAKPRILARRLGLPPADLDAVRQAVKRLVRRELLAYDPGHRVRAPMRPRAAQAHTLTGTFRRAEAGFGFVRPQPPHNGQGDIYVPARYTLDAAQGDVVLVKVLQQKGRFGIRQGMIVEIIERERHRFVGTYFEAAGGGYVQVDGAVFAAPLPVGDPGAKRAQPNDKVVFEMLRFPSQSHEGEGVIVEVLGPSGAPGVDTLSIIREYDLPGDFPRDVLAAARSAARSFDPDALNGRLDLTAKTVVTIDPPDARDFDDAISLERTAHGHWLLGVHIADVAHFVRPGTPLDAEARQRATSVYLPDRVIPMLPEVLSNGVASLQPGKLRYTLSALMELSADGALIACEVVPAAIRSARRFTYEEVDAYLADRQAWREKLSPEVHALLGRMHELAMLLRARRMHRGALELNLAEVKIELDRHGRVQGARRVVHTESHQIIEEFMLQANEAVAAMLHEAGVAFLRRVHGAPDPRKLDALAEFVAALSFPVDSLHSRFELQDVLRRAAGTPAEQAVNYAVLRSMQRAVYSPEPDGHYALASEHYCHFTSPIRRYPDLTVHRMVKTLLSRGKVRADFAELAALARHCSEREQRAEAAERELVKVKLLHYFSSRMGEEFEAVITGVEEYGLFAQGLDLPAEGLLHASALPPDDYLFDRRTHSLTGRRTGRVFRLGDPLRVAVARVDIERRELDFRLVRCRPRPAAAAHKPDRKGRAAQTPPKRGRSRKD